MPKFPHQKTPPCGKMQKARPTINRSSSAMAASMRMGAMARKAEESHNQTDVSYIRNMTDFQCGGSAWRLLY
jgi:hypothetical protein